MAARRRGVGTLDTEDRRQGSDEIGQLGERVQ